MRDPPEATPGHKEVRSEEGKGGGGAGPWRVSPARTAMAVRGQIGLVAGLVSKSSATRTRRRACSDPDVNYRLRHLVQKKERAVLVLTEGLWWPGLRRRWAAAWTSDGARRGGCGDGCCRVLQASGLHEPTWGGCCEGLTGSGRFRITGIEQLLRVGLTGGDGSKMKSSTHQSRGRGSELWNAS